MKIALSDDLQIYHSMNGVKLATSTDKSHSIEHSISAITKLPLSFYLLNSAGATQLINEEGVSICGFDSITHSLGKTIVEVSQEQSATQLIHNCFDVIKTNSIKIIEEEYVRKDGTNYQFLSIKLPWYDANDCIIGICGFSIVLGKHSLASSLTMLNQLGFLQSSLTPKYLPLIDLGLSKRERECLLLTIKGYTAKRIAKQLGISHRTVEEYLTNMRHKMNVATKAELIEFAIDKLLPP